MGYRSRVCISARSEAAKQLLESQFAREFADETHEFIKDGVSYAFARADWIKWYEHDDVYPEVDEITKLREDFYNDVNFVRVGEEYDDIEAQIGFWEDPYNVQPSVDICYVMPKSG